MVELQETLPQLERAGIAPYAISYDPVPVLDGFAREKGITFPLLSDDGSQVITRIGLLNRHVRSQHEETNEVHEKRFEGVPYPAAYVLDETGTIVDRRMHSDYRIRESVAALVGGRFGFESEPPDGFHTVEDVVEITVTAESDRFSPYQMIWFEFEIQIEPGWHVYSTPVPPGLQPLEVGIEAKKYLDSGEALFDQRPDTRDVAGADQPVTTFRGVVRGRVPVVVATSRGLPVDVDGYVEYQACSTTECLPPRKLPWAFQLHPRRS